MNIFIGNLSYNVTEGDLRQAFVTFVRIPAKTATYSGNNFTTHPLIQFPR